MKVFIVVAVIIVTICLACLMKAKAEGDRIYDELAYKYFSSKEETDLQESYSISLNLIHTIKIQSFYSAEERMTG